MKDLTIFENSNFGELRLHVDELGVPWFVAKDVCRSLGLENSRSSLTSLRGRLKGVHRCDTPGGAQVLATVNEAGLYKLIFKSRKPEEQK